MLNIILLIVACLCFIALSMYNPLHNYLVVSNLQRYFYYESYGPTAYIDFQNTLTLCIVISSILGLLSYIYLERMIDKKLIIVGSCAATGIFAILSTVFGANVLFVISNCLFTFFKFLLIISLSHYIYLRFNYKYVIGMIIILISTPFIRLGDTLNYYYRNFEQLSFFRPNLSAYGSAVVNTAIIPIAILLIAILLFVILKLSANNKSYQEAQFDNEIQEVNNSIFDPVLNPLRTKNIVLIVLFSIFAISLYYSITWYINLNCTRLWVNDYSWTLNVIPLLIMIGYIVMFFIFDYKKITIVSLILMGIIISTSSFGKIEIYHIIAMMSLKIVMVPSLIAMIATKANKTQFHGALAISLSIGIFVSNLYANYLNENYYITDKFMTIFLFICAFLIIFSMIICFVIGKRKSISNN